MKTTQILIAGFGGQGILFAGKFLAYKGLMEEKMIPYYPLGVYKDRSAATED